MSLLPVDVSVTAVHSFGRYPKSTFSGVHELVNKHKVGTVCFATIVCFYIPCQSRVVGHYTRCQGYESQKGKKPFFHLSAYLFYLVYLKNKKMSNIGRPVLLRLFWLSLFLNLVA
jgi:hypothetical protein